MYQESSNLLVSNHSYHDQATAWYGNTSASNYQWWYGDWRISQSESYEYGFYNERSKTFDQIMYSTPFYMIVQSAGNERNPSWVPDPMKGLDDTMIKKFDGSGEWTTAYLKELTTIAEKNGGSDGFDCLVSEALAKNIISVGAVQKIQNGYSIPSDVVATIFTSFGPSDDGRIKPDIVAPGYNMFTTATDLEEDYSEPEDKDKYANVSGTSFSAPLTTGAIGILQEHYQNTHNDFSMLSSTVKALICHTAFESGQYDGPDYQFGWGLLNANDAAKKISEDDNSKDVIKEIILKNGSTYSKNLYVCKEQDLKVTIAWTDPPGTPVLPSLNPDDPMLVNDLDLRVYHNNSTYYPWVLDVENPGYPADNDETDNEVDNIEQVLIEDAPAGNYTIEVTHKGTLVDDDGNTCNQVFSMIIDNDIDGCEIFHSDCCDNFVWDLVITDDECQNGDCNVVITGMVGHPNNCHSTYEIWELVGQNWIILDDDNLSSEGSFENSFCITSGDHTFKIQLRDANENIICVSDPLTVSCNDCCQNLKAELILTEECTFDGDGEVILEQVCGFKLKISDLNDPPCDDIYKIVTKQPNVIFGRFLERSLSDDPFDFNGASGLLIDDLGCYSNPLSLHWDEATEKWIETVTFIIEFYDDENNLLCSKIVTNGCERDEPGWIDPFYEPPLYIDDNNIFNDNSNIIRRFKIIPNPTDSYADIEFDLIDNCYVSIEIFNYYGLKIDSIYEGYLQSGLNKIQFNTVAQKPGFYFITITADEDKVAKPLLIIK